MDGTRKSDGSSLKFPAFDRRFFDSGEDFTVIGDGELGGKASGLAFVRDILRRSLPGRLPPGVVVDIPRLTVITTSFFDEFMTGNGLDEYVHGGMSDDQLAVRFQQADLPVMMLGDLRALIETVRQPLAVRSSSRLEDALYEPFAGIYATKMIPNNQFSPDDRFRRLVEAVKFVYASTYFRTARDYLAATRHDPGQEKMAVIIQEVIGRRHGQRFYPDISGVARTYNYYPTGRARPEDGVVNLALGLGKTIVDGDPSWFYSPAWPRVSPPYGSPTDTLRQTQLSFWSINMGRPVSFDPTRETEYLAHAHVGAPQAALGAKTCMSTSEASG